MALYPCRGCIYFKVCGENMRTMPCNGRVTKTDKKKEGKNRKCTVLTHNH